MRGSASSRRTPRQLGLPLPRSRARADPGHRNLAVRIQPDTPMRRAMLVPDGIDIITMVADAEKLDGLNRTELGVTGMQIRQLAAGRLLQRGSHFLIIGFAAGETIDEPEQ